MESINLTWIIMALIAAFTITGVVGAFTLFPIAKTAPTVFGPFIIQAARVAIVVFIVIAAVVLALTGKLDHGVIALLSGVAGYTLGGVDRSKKTAPEALPGVDNKTAQQHKD